MTRHAATSKSGVTAATRAKLAARGFRGGSTACFIQSPVCRIGVALENGLAIRVADALLAPGQDVNTAADLERAARMLGA